MLNFLSMLQGGAGAAAGGGAASGGGNRFFEALGAQKMGGGGGGKPWDRGIGMQYANTAMQAPDMRVQPMNMRLGQQQRQQQINPLMQMLMQGVR